MERKAFRSGRMRRAMREHCRREAQRRDRLKNHPCVNWVTVMERDKSRLSHKRRKRPRADSEQYQVLGVIE